MKTERYSSIKHRKKYSNIRRESSRPQESEHIKSSKHRDYRDHRSRRRGGQGAQGSLPQSQALSELWQDRTGTRLGGAVEGQGEGRAGYALREGLESPGAGLERPVGVHLLLRPLHRGSRKDPEVTDSLYRCSAMIRRVESA